MADNAYVPPEIASLMGLIDTHLRWSELQKFAGSRSYKHYHPSEFGKCLRHQQYKHFVELGYINVEHVANSGQTIRTFDKGHNMHHRWQQWYFAEMGILRGVWKCANTMCLAFDNEGKFRWDALKEEQRTEIWKGRTRVYGEDDKLGCFRPDKCACGSTKFYYHELEVKSEELNFLGHCDIVLDFQKFDPEKYKSVRKNFNMLNFPKRPIVIDMKTVGDWQFKNQVQKLGVHKAYIIQLNIYMHLLDCEYGVVIYENKSDSITAPFKIDRDDSIFDTVKEQATMMKALAEKRLLPPPRPLDESDYECSKCGFATLCHKSPVWKDPKLKQKRQGFYKNLL